MMFMFRKNFRNMLLNTDIQGLWYQLCDPEIAIKTIAYNPNNSLKVTVEYLSCACNLPTKAFKNFKTGHVLSRYCEILDLTEL